MNKRGFTHDANFNINERGISKHYLYYCWLSMKSRCYSVKNTNYKNYGGRGIKVCPEWMDDVYAFFNWAIENGYKKGAQIERINNNGDYSPENCRFTTKTMNQRNRRNTIYVTYNNERRALVEWAALLDIRYSELSYRLFKKRMPVEDAFNKDIPTKKVRNIEEAILVGSNIKKILKSEGRKQRWVLERLEELNILITDVQFSNKLKGIDSFNNIQLSGISEVLGVDIEVLYTPTEEMA